jgi:hypothetical protein
VKSARDWVDSRAGRDMSLPSTARGAVYSSDGANVSGSINQLGHRQRNLSRSSLLPSDSISVSGGMGGSRNTASKVDPTWDTIDVQRPPAAKASTERPASGNHAFRDPEYLQLGIFLCHPT